MSEKRQCIRCEREIDAYAKICPYCNWDQTQTDIPPPSQQTVVDAYVPPAERNWKRHIMIALGGVGLLILSFFVGALINSDAAPEEAPAPVVGGDAQTAAQVAPAKRSDVTLVPVTDVEAPITTAPVAAMTEGIPTEYQRSDATAVSSVEYAQLAARAKEEKRRNAALVDPRSLTGPAYAQAQAQRPPAVPAQSAPIPPPQTSADNGRFDDRRSQPEPTSPRSNDEPARVVTRTRPIPVSQPLPNISVDRDVTARLDLTVGPDGRVKAVNLREGIPGHTAKLIASVQQWRFKPATENGVPVSAPFTVDISFRGNE